MATGNEVIILDRKRDLAVLGKVRSNGGDIEDWLEEVGHKVMNMSVEDVWKTYYQWRTNRMSEESLKDEINSGFQAMGFFFSPGAASTHEDLLKVAENAIRLVSKTDGLLCGYGDYGVMIDLNNRTISTNEDNRKAKPTVAKADKRLAFQFVDNNGDYTRYDAVAQLPDDGVPGNSRYLRLTVTTQDGENAELTVEIVSADLQKVQKISGSFISFESAASLLYGTARVETIKRIRPI
jgi:hypothetical protein